MVMPLRYLLRWPGGLGIARRWWVLLAIAFGMWPSVIVAVPTNSTPTLFRSRLYLEPALRQARTMPEAEAAWYLTEGQAERLVAFVGPDAVVPRRYRRGEQKGTPAFVVVPDEELLDRLRPEDRLAWWRELARSPENASYRWPLAISQPTMKRLAADARFGEAVDRLNRWGVGWQGNVLFADDYALAGAFADEETRGAFWQRVLGSEQIFAKVVIDAENPSEAAAGATYWLSEGRSRALEPILAAVAMLEGHDRLDLVHLLPRLARSLLYTYPQDYGVEWEPAVDNAVLAAGFFDPDIDPGPVLAQGFGPWLLEHCEKVDGPRRFGDILVFEDPAGVLWPYALIHIADGLLLGRSPSWHGPWELVEEADVGRRNPRFAGAEVQVFRPQTDDEAKRSLGLVMPSEWLRKSELQDLPSGPWGRLKAYDVLLAPSRELLQNIAPPSPVPQWIFAGLSRREIDRVLTEVPMSDETRSDLRDVFSAAVAGPGDRLEVHPSIELVLATPAAVRERLFGHLVHGSMAGDYAQLVSLPTQLDAPTWFEPGLLPATARELVLRLVYRRDGGLALSDFGALYHALVDTSQRVAVLRALYRRPALIVLMDRPESAADVPGLVNYWRQDQPLSLSRMLEAFEQADDMHYLDIVHLLPPLAREMVNTHLIASADTPTPSCYWTALNFMAERPSPLLLVTGRQTDTQGELAWQRLQEDYELVETVPRFGDVIAYRRDIDGFLLHVCSYVAADVVYTKNGFGLSNPWCMMRLAEVDRLYAGGGGVSRLVFRPR